MSVNMLKEYRNLLSWFGGRPQRTYHRQRYTLYWTWRGRLQRIRFRIGRNAFRARSWARSRRESASIFSELATIVVGRLLFALALVGGLEFLERVLLPRLFALAGAYVSLPGGGVVRALESLVSQLQLDPQVYADLLATMIQIAGVFLGLYFTAVSVVASTIYARVQGDVRDLFVREQVGNFYIRTVALLGITATILLATKALGYAPGVLNLALTALLGGLSILSFVVLGGRVFHFFDPVPLVEYVGRDLAREIAAVTPEGFRWQDRSFQHHHQIQAEKLLDTYGNIVHMATREDDLRGEALTQLANSALWLFRFYVQNKSRVPSDSRWFKREHRHKDWLTSSATELEVALNTGTSLVPEERPDPTWFEARLVRIVVRIVKALLERGDLRNAVEVYDGVRRTTHFLGRRMCVDEALELFRSLEEVTSEHAHDTDFGTEAVTSKGERLSFLLGLIDVQGVALVNVLLGLSERLRATTADSFGGAVSQIAWRRQGSIYDKGFPRLVVERLEELREGIETERALEGRVVSPTWYLQQLAALGFVRLLSEAAEKLVAELERAFAEEAESLVSDGRHLLAAQVIDRGLEACNKYAFHFAEFEGCFKRLGELRRVEDVPWPAPEWEALARRISAAKERLVRSLAECLPELAAIPRSEELPDYFGQAYTILAEESYYAMAGGDEDLFAKVFPPFFAGCLSANERLIGQFSDLDGKTAAMWSTEPLADLLELSGHALIYSELDGKGYWSTVEGLWDRYFSGHPNPAAVLGFLNDVVGKREQVFFGITPRGLVRTSWQQDLERRLRERGLVDDVFSFDPFHGKKDGDKHESKLIRVLTRDRHMFQEPHDVFLAAYSTGRPEFSGLELPHEAKALVDELADEPDGEPEAEEEDGGTVQET